MERGKGAGLQSWGHLKRKPLKSTLFLFAIPCSLGETDRLNVISINGWLFYMTISAEFFLSSP